MDLFERVKCKTCKTNFGAENRGWLCSVCYKNFQEKQDIAQTIQESVKETKIEEDPNKIKQTNIYNCWKCEKKVGHLGFKCDCGYIFCKSHRHFGDHDCTFDIKLNKQQIKN